MKKLFSICAFLISESSFGQFNIGTYLQLYKGNFIRIYFSKDHKFSFHDTRNENCYHWNTYKGKWEISNDTLTLIYPWKYIEYNQTGRDNKLTEKNVIEKRLFLVAGDTLKFIGGEGKYSIFDWGIFKYYRRK